MGHCRLSFLFVRFLSRTCLTFRALDLVKWIGGSVLISWQFSTCAYYPTTSALSLPWWRPQSSCLCFIPSLTADWWNQHGRLCSVPLLWCDAYSSLKCVLDVRVRGGYCWKLCLDFYIIHYNEFVLMFLWNMLPASFGWLNLV